jgi:Cof subfamily protein (haloacid dehalogenase superfamily)
MHNRIWQGGLKMLSDWIIMSDVDGTLLGSDFIIPQRNIDAIHRFTGEGGRFGIATGRSWELVSDLFYTLHINYPCILYNGCSVLDFSTRETLFDLFLPGAAKEYAQTILGAFPHLGVLAIDRARHVKVQWEVGFSNYSFTGDKSLFEHKVMAGNPAEWYKILFLAEERDLDKVFAFAQGLCCPGVRFVTSSENLMEMLPRDSSKGAALERLARHTGDSLNRVAAIGDYNNDYEMIRVAGLGTTLSTAPERLRRVADLVVGDCVGGAVADLVEYIERHC